MKTPTNTWAILIAISAASALLSGCNVDSGMEEEGEAELVEEAEAAFGEATCNTTAIANATDQSGLKCADTVSYASASSVYGQASCTNAFVVDADGTYTLTGAAWAFVANSTDADSSAECTGIVTELIRYPGNSGLAQSMKLYGHWENRGFLGWQCVLRDSNGQENTELSAVHGDRFIARARRGNTSLRVRLTLSGNKPC